MARLGVGLYCRATGDDIPGTDGKGGTLPGQLSLQTVSVILGCEICSNSPTGSPSSRSSTRKTRLRFTSTALSSTRVLLWRS